MRAPQSPDVDRRGHARAVVRDVEVGNHLRNLFQGCDVPPFQVRASDYGSRYGLVAQVEALFDGRDLDVLHLDNGVRQCRSGVFRQRGGGTYAHGVQEYARRQKDDMDRLADHRIVRTAKTAQTVESVGFLRFRRSAAFAFTAIVRGQRNDIPIVFATLIYEECGCRFRPRSPC